VETLSKDGIKSAFCVYTLLQLLLNSKRNTSFNMVVHIGLSSDRWAGDDDGFSFVFNEAFSWL